MGIQRSFIGVALGVSLLVGQAGVATAGEAGAPRAPQPWGPIGSSVPLVGSSVRRAPERATAASVGSPSSPNWSGDIYTGPTFSGVKAGWTVPAVIPQLGRAAEAQWLGIDGASNSDLIQTGTAAINSNGSLLYYAWYEILPAPPQEIGAVAPGDHMSSTIEQVSSGIWSISIADDTSGHSATGQVSYGGPGSSAEFIEERPFNSATQSLETLADYASMQYDTFRVRSDQSVPTQHQAVSMTNDAGAVISVPGAYNATSDSEVIRYTGPKPPPPQGYWLLGQDGGVFSFGNAGFHGSTGALKLNKPIVSLAARPDRLGYWFVASDGGVFSFDAPFFGSTGNLSLTKPVVGMAPTSDGAGYWLVAADGGIFSFGDARFFGSTGAITLNQPIVGMAPTPDGGGYWFVARDGGIFSFGDAGFFGSGVGHSTAPVVGMAASVDGRGYFLARADGEVQTFGSATSVASAAPGSAPAPVVGISLTPSGAGYRLVTTTGRVAAVGDAVNFGSAPSSLNAPVVGIG